MIPDTRWLYIGGRSPTSNNTLDHNHEYNKDPSVYIQWSENYLSIEDQHTK